VEKLAKYEIIIAAHLIEREDIFDIEKNVLLKLIKVWIIWRNRNTGTHEIERIK